MHVVRHTCKGNCGAVPLEEAAGSPFCTTEPSTVLLALVLMTGIRSNRPALHVCVMQIQYYIHVQRTL